MKIVNEKKIGDEVEVQFEFDADEYDSLYEDYLKEKELYDKDADYSFEDYFQELITLTMLKEKDKRLKQELEDIQKEIRFLKGEIQVKKDSNNS